MSAPITHVVEWSDLEKAYRIRTHSEFLDSNVSRFHEGAGERFAPLAFFTSGDDAAEFLKGRNEQAARNGQEPDAA